MKGKIYKITNKVNGKIYIGLTVQSLKERFYKHCAKYNKDTDKYHFFMPIKQAIFKYGKENFTIELIEEVEVNKLDDREKYWISYFNSYNTGYNCTLGGQNSATRRHRLSYKEENEVIEAKYLGFSSKEIGEVYNIDNTTVKNIFKRHGLLMPNKRNLNSRISISEFKKFIETKPSLKDIMKKYNICKCSVYNFIKKSNIEYNFSKSVQTLSGKAEG